MLYPALSVIQSADIMSTIYIRVAPAIDGLDILSGVIVYPPSSLPSKQPLIVFFMSFHIFLRLLVCLLLGSLKRGDL